MMNVCPVVVISHRPWSLAEIKWKPSQRPAAWPLHHLPQKTPPPMAGKGTEGHGGTAEKTRHTGVQPLNPGVTVKGLRSLLEWYICLAAPRSVQPMHPSEGNAHIYTDAATDIGVWTCKPELQQAYLLLNTFTHQIQLCVHRPSCSAGDYSFWDMQPTRPVAYWPYRSAAHTGLFGANEWHAILPSAVVSGGICDLYH